MGLAHGLDSDWCFAILDACTYPEGKMIPLLMLITVTATGSGPERETEHRFVCAKMQSSYTSFRLWPPLALDDSTAKKRMQQVWVNGHKAQTIYFSSSNSLSRASALTTTSRAHPSIPLSARSCAHHNRQQVRRRCTS